MIFKPLGSLAKIIAGQSPESSTYNSIGQGLPFFQGKADFKDMYPTVRMWCTSVKRKEAEPNDILISVRAPVGAVNICNQKSIIGRGLAAIRPFSELDEKFLYYYLKANEKQIDALGTGSTFKAITQDTLKKFEIPVPLRNDQIRIAHLLGKVEGLIAQRKQHLRHLDDLVKSMFLKMFGDPVRNERGWETSTIEGFCSLVVDCPHSTPEYSEGNTGYYCVRSSDIVDGYLDLTKTYHVDGNIYEDRVARYSPQKNDIIYSREGGRLGNAARIISGEKICLGQRIMLFQVNPTNTPEFMWALLESVHFKAKLQGLIGGGAAPRVNIKDLKKLVVIKPTPDLQLSFSKFVLKIDQLRDQYKQHFTELKALYGALSQQAFKGELDLSRVPLPGIKPEEVKAVAAEPLNTHIEEDLAINLPDTGTPLDALGNTEARATLIGYWLEAYRCQLNSMPFSIQHFMMAAQNRLAELHPDTDFELGANDYEYIKTWVFKALAAGTLKQAFDDAGNRIQLKAVQV
ncbi:restriction endonuclease subunit S [Pseudomonas sp. PDM32]|uniref:restriction endonuclease subunit S n=1 Tax=Pseudomonas sp. PDM32 TaxID=2854768 RepID=UPI001C464AEC|nr:restriction endonuclease subunit S [Pseudomonas sp. PDM32]MBV7571674.1 restriction endonuclease subunit S [Pseudomonas sp. PDM32]